MCIGAGETWLANMDHRYCVNDRKHFESYIDQSCGKRPDCDICSIDSEITDEQRANAQLISAAPELYEAAKLAIAHFQGDKELTSILVELGLLLAIAKAEGKAP